MMDPYPPKPPPFLFVVLTSPAPRQESKQPGGEFSFSKIRELISNRVHYTIAVIDVQLQSSLQGRFA